MPAPWPRLALADDDDDAPNSTPAVRASLEYVAELSRRERDEWLAAVAGEGFCEWCSADGSQCIICRTREGVSRADR